MKYIGVKIVEAVLMTLGEYNIHRGWTIPENEDPERQGYHVIYPDGYESWCPKEQFEEANRQTTAMPFGHAIEAAKKGLAIARSGWNGKRMFVVYMPELKLPPFNDQTTNRKVNDRTAKWIGEDAPLNSVPYFAMRAADGSWVPGWLASQTDMLADDWMIIENTVSYISKPQVDSGPSDPPTIEGFAFYRKKNLQQLRPYIPGEDLSNVSVSNEDTPEEGGMIAINPSNPADQWYVAKKFFEDNYQPA